MDTLVYGMTKILMFDLGGVLVENDMFTSLSALTGGVESEAEVKARWLRSEAAREFELGGTSPHEFARAVVVEFDLALSPDEFIQAFAGWPKGLDDEARALLNLHETITRM